MQLLLSVINAEDHKIIHQIEHRDVPIEYNQQVPYLLIESAITCAAAVRTTHLVPAIGQYTYTEYNPLRDILHCKILVSQL